MPQALQDALQTQSIIDDQSRKVGYRVRKEQLDQLRAIWELAGDADASDEYARANSRSREEYADLMNQLLQIRTNPNYVVAYNPNAAEYQWADKDVLKQWLTENPDVTVPYYNSTSQAHTDLAEAYSMPNPSVQPKVARLVAAAAFPRTGPAGGAAGLYPDDELMNKHTPTKADVVADLAETGVAASTLGMTSGPKYVMRMLNNALPVLGARTAGRAYDELSNSDDDVKTPLPQMGAETVLAGLGGLAGGVVRPGFKNIERKKLIYNKLKEDAREKVGKTEIGAQVSDPDKVIELGIKKPTDIPNSVLRAADKGLGKKEFVNYAYAKLDPEMSLTFERIPTLIDANGGKALARLPTTRPTEIDVDNMMRSMDVPTRDVDRSRYQGLAKDLMNRHSVASQNYQPTRRLGQTGKINLDTYANDLYRLGEQNDEFSAQLMRNRVKANDPSTTKAFKDATADYSRRQIFSPAMDVAQQTQYKKLLPIWRRDRRSSIPESANDGLIKSGIANTGEALGSILGVTSSTLPHANDLQSEAKSAKRWLKD